MGLHWSFYLGVLMMMGGGYMFAFTFGSKTVGRDTCWLLVGLGIVTAVYGTFVGRKDQLTGNGRRKKDHFV